jgi:hypothetical protein
MVKLRRLQVTNGSARNGGGIFNRAKLWLTDCTVVNNAGAYQGGGIYSDGYHAHDAELRLTRCAVTNNRAGPNTIGLGLGGGIASFGGRVTLAECTVTDNQADHGGGIDAGKTTLTLEATEVARNRANHSGGGLHVGGGWLTLRDASLVTDNDADPTDPESGGGIRALAVGGRVAFLDTSRVTGNRPNDCTGTLICPG